ncbi:hypothetical protein [Mesorhizobium sp. ANAO-SY3R2]|uniref:hypothetical protein n=1 Tax=Mesorhizobium sp. ANAO-SY3R2 TaxID=3166644 RepID=UPI00366A785B
MRPLLDGDEDPTTVLVAREIEAISVVDIVDWANRHAAAPAYAEDTNYQRLVRSNPRNVADINEAESRLKALITQCFPDFNIKSKDAEERARTVFLRRIRAYLDGELQPFQVCRMLTPIADAYGFPHWLHDFYEACDWIDERTTREHASHLRDGIEQILVENGVSHTQESE